MSATLNPFGGVADDSLTRVTTAYLVQHYDASGAAAAETSRAEAAELALQPTSRAFTGLMHKLRAGETTALQCISDSTGTIIGVGNPGWVYSLATWLAGQFPNYCIRYRLWNAVTNDFSPPQYIANGAGEVRLNWSGTNSGNAAYLASGVVTWPTNGLDLRVRVDLANWQATAAQNLLARWHAAGQRSFEFLINTYANGNNLVYIASTDGTASTYVAASSVAPAGTTGTALWLRVTHVWNNGSNQNVITFYTSTDGQTWTPLGTATTLTGVASVFNGTSEYEIGSVSGSNTIVGSIYDANVRDTSGSAGPLGPMNITAWQPTTPTVYTGITFQGSPTLDIVNASLSGANITSWIAAGYENFVQDWGQISTIVALIKNDSTNYGVTYLSTWATFMASVNIRQPSARPVLLTECPSLNSISSYYELSLRRSNLLGWSSLNSFEIIDTWQAFITYAGGVAALLNSDGIHPNPSGLALWVGMITAAMVNS